MDELVLVLPARVGVIPNKRNVIVEIQKDGKNFLVGVEIGRKDRGIEISRIETVLNKKTSS